MRANPIDPAAAPTAQGGYTQGFQVTGASQLLFISGQIPVTADGKVPDGFEAQCRQAWANLTSVLDDAGMTVENLVKVTTFLSRRQDAEVSSKVRREVLGSHRPALTVIITGIYDEGWLLEVEAIAAA